MSAHWPRRALLAIGFAGTLATACAAPTNRVTPVVTLRRDSSFAAHIRAASAADSDVIVARWLMPSWLSEISGITLRDDRLAYVHDDETATISLVDVRRGEVVRRFGLGQPPVHGDFESITTVGDSLYLMSSKGVIYVFSPRGSETTVAYRTFDTHLRKECEFEGVVYDSATSSLYLPCKKELKKKEKKRDEGMLVVFRLPLPLGTTDDVARLELPLVALDSSKKEPAFQASDITRDPSTGHLVVLASRQRALLEFTTDGDVVREVALPKSGHHEQPEGIAITRDGLLIVSDEAVRTPAKITVYRWPLRAMRTPAEVAP